MKKKSILFFVMIFTLAGICHQASAITAFHDMYGHWAEADVNNLLYVDIVTGYEDGNYMPENNINLNEIIVMVTRALDEEITSEGAWDESYIQKAKELGWIDSTSAKYDRPAVREEVFELIARAFLTENNDAELTYTDASEISGTRRSYIAAMQAAGLAKGYEDGSFRPGDYISRAEAASLLNRALMYVPMGEYVEKIWNVIDAPYDENTPFSFWARKGTAYKFEDYFTLPLKLEGKTAIYSPNGAAVKPSVAIETKSDAMNVLTAIDNESFEKAGGYTNIVFTAPENGNYIFSYDCKNIGHGGLGGDGGFISLKYLGKENRIPMTFKYQAVPSSHTPDFVISGTETVKLAEGDMVHMEVYSGKGSVYDKFNIEYTVSTTREEGTRYINHEEKDLLPLVPLKKKAAGVPITDNQVFVGVAGDWAIGNFVYETVDILKQYISKPAMNWYGTSAHAYVENAEYFKEQGIPILVQNYLTYSDWYDIHNAWEINYKGEVAHRTSGFTLADKGHAASKSSQAINDAFEYNIRTVARNGLSAFGYTDWIWMYGAGRGYTGYNPETIASFKRNLKGEDEGIEVTFYGGAPQIIHFKDYAEYYMGSMLEPQQLGYESWDEWHPLLHAEMDFEADQQQYEPQKALFDLLINYEMLRVSQHAGAVAKEEGIDFQILPNPEDQGNGNDELFQIGLDKVKMLTTEEFNHAAFLDGGYYHFPYLTKHAADDKSYGMVLECGGGGNTGRYYDEEIGYMLTYELTASSGMRHFEVDWWPTIERELQYSLENVKVNAHKAQIALAYCVAYEDAVEDNLTRQEGDFVSVTARYKNRPWGDYYPWGWYIWIEGSPEFALAKNGYIYDGIGQDGIPDIDKEKVVVYSPQYPARHNFEQLFEKLKKGDVENVIAPPVSLINITDFDYKVKDMEEVYPQYALRKGEEETELSGSLTNSSGEVIAENIEFKNIYYTPVEGAETELCVGDTPVVVSKQVGNGKLYMVLFDPNSEPNYDLTVAVYNYLLGSMGIKQQFVTNEASGILIGDVDFITDAKSVPGKGKFEQNASVRIYKNDDMRVVGIQNPLSRYWINDPSTQSSKNIPYRITGNTDVSVRLEPDTTYDYVAMPSGNRGTVSSDKEGFVNLSFTNVSHQIFYLLPPTTENQIKLAEISKRRLLFEDSKTVGGLIETKDTVSPATNIIVEGKKEGNVYYDKATVKLVPEDQLHGSGIKSVEYSINDGEFVTAVKRSEINPEICAVIELTDKGTHNVQYRAVDRVGNVEKTGWITVEIE